MTRFLAPSLLLTLLLAGCALPQWMRSSETPPESEKFGWFGDAESIAVQEAARASVCNTVGGESEVRVFPNLAALEAFAASRGMEWISNTGKPLPDTAYAVVEFGQRPNSGYGLAVSRRAGLRKGVLLLSATYFEPQPGRWAGTAPSSPCVALSLPAVQFTGVHVLDQSGKLRAQSEAAAS